MPHFRLNSSNFYEGDDLLKTELDEQLKEIHKCYHQKYLNTKPNINNINESNCLKQKCKLIIEKNNDNIEIWIEYKIDVEKSQEMKKQNMLEKQIHVRNFYQRNQQTFTKFRETNNNKTENDKFLISKWK